MLIQNNYSEKSNNYSYTQYSQTKLIKAM